MKIEKQRFFFVELLSNFENHNLGYILKETDFI